MPNQLSSHFCKTLTLLLGYLYPLLGIFAFFSDIAPHSSHGEVI